MAMRFSYVPGIVQYSYDTSRNERVALFMCECGGTSCPGGFALVWPKSWPDIQDKSTDEAAKEVYFHCNFLQIEELEVSVEGTIRIYAQAHDIAEEVTLQMIHLAQMMFPDLFVSLDHLYNGINAVSNAIEIAENITAIRDLAIEQISKLHEMCGPGWFDKFQSNTSYLN